MPSPPPQLPEQHDEQRCGVGGSVVGAAAAKSQPGSGTEPELVQDLAWFFFCRRFDAAALAVGEGLQRARGEAIVPGQQHPRGEQRVTSEQGHEPGGTRGYHGPVRMTGVEDTQRPDVLDTPAQHQGQVRFWRPHPGGAVPPLAEPAGRDGVLHGLPGPMVRCHRDPVADRYHLDGGQPFAARRDYCPPGQGTAGGGGLPVAANQEPVTVFTTAGVKGQCRADGGHAGRGGLRQAGLDLEQVGEVGIHAEHQRQFGWLAGSVVDGDVLAHAVTEVTAPGHQHGGVGRGAGRRWQAPDERPGERVGLLDGHRFGGPAVDSQGPP